MTGTIRVGTRGSALAVAQAGEVAEALSAASGMPFELVTVTTHGDTSRASLATIGGTGVFAAALREALLDGECDVVVHSLKDLPTTPFPGLSIAATPRRADARDALCARDGLTLEALPEGARVGTGSPRRVAQLRARRPDLDVRDIRGNVDTRLGFVADGELDAVVLAAAGLTRVGRATSITELFPLESWPTAPGQGVLALEVRDEKVAPQFASGLAAVHHSVTQLTASAERTVLAEFEAGCSAPIGATALVDDGMLFLSATVYSADGGRSLTASHAGVLEGHAPERLQLAHDVAGRVVAELIERGARDLEA